MYLKWSESEVTQSCPTLCDPMDCSPPGSSVHGISQARILEGVAISYSRGSSQPRDWTQVSCTGRWILYFWATREAFFHCCCSVAKSCWLCATPWTVAHQTSLSFAISLSLLKLMSIESVMPSNHLILSPHFSSCPPSFPASGSFLLL